ncbi:nuclear transport factor 2 family protein [Neolewinella lacunae]|uniref:Nuclear transport factor 2 family protein n=1 Tax=Neolewinella lacunae TaxID=1517758 RepID=A0A923PG76_9BACT|nr:nuclear transport factor 2 family protein [Neolewinella lacunae]MBC6993548.1 nuclear transport factor 2 family protein [Neolewinella lacunae]MDN3636176.1 nuclear transport factor 2 family protein [Neolewinella lacunae]
MRTLLLFFCLGAGVLLAQSTEDRYAFVAPVQTQLDAYNTSDLELFLSAYSDSVRVYQFPAALQYQGKENMRANYIGMFESLPDLQCRLLNRVVMGDRVIDHESVIFNKDNPPVEVVAIYRVADGLIQEVWFMR